MKQKQIETAILSAKNYLNRLSQSIKENKNEFVNCNKRTIQQGKELTARVSVYEFAEDNKYKNDTIKYIYSIFGKRGK